MASLLKTFMLLGLLSILLIFVGGLLGGRQGLYMAFFFSLLMNGGASFFSAKIALAASGAKPLSRSQNPELYQMVEELSHKIKIPMPKLYMTPARQANAFATGRGPGHASVAVTQGILDVLSKDELRGVLAHELAHVKNRDILIASIAAVIASSISFLANMAMWGGLMGNNNDEDNPGAGIPGLLIALLVPIAASIIQMAVSRQREYAADETGAKTIGNGKSLANALLAIHDTTRRAPLHTNPAYSSLYIENPLGGVGNKMMNLFSTHPPVEERVKRLRAMR
ncbi:MAG TPA: zinc metalloprotease HtpX [Candidatus Levybacteria bacterium]|nr:zinc metalloprotease HtpX [Candidatus Levybacteria bacterium]